MPSRRATAFATLALTTALAGPGAAQSTTQLSGFTPGTRTIYQLSFANLRPDSLPRGIKVLLGNVGIGTKDGKPTLVTNKPSEILVTLPEALPPDFTLEFEIAAKKCCNPEDLMFEGTPAMNRGPTSAQVTWHPEHIMVVGGGELYQTDMPEELKVTLPGTLSEVDASYNAGTLKLYTNGKRLFTLSDRKFAHGRVLRVWLGGQEGAEYAVHLSELRIATNSPKPPARKAP